jgi:predicted nucleic-acid-binding protein
MLAVDTNVIVRLLTLDEPRQAARARTAFARETIFLPKTVLLETEWVLRRLYGFDQNQIAAAFAALIALNNVRCEDLTAVTTALKWLSVGMDFADALHVASSGLAQRFGTFDANLVKRAKKHATPEVVAI